MIDLQPEQISGSLHYLTGLLQRNSKASSKARDYVAIKNVSISQKLINGQQQLNQKQSQIKIPKQSKNNSEIQKKKLKVIEAQKQKLENKILLIQSEISKNSKRSDNSSERNINQTISDEERLKFVKEKRKQNILILKRKQQNLKQNQQKQKQLKQKKEQEQERIKEQNKQKKLEQAKKKIQEIQKRKEQRIIENKKTNQILKGKSMEKILAEKINDRFLSSQNLLLDERKKKLAELRQIHRPFDRLEIEQHIKKFENSKIQKSRTKQSQKVNSTSEKTNQYYRSIFYDILEKQRKQKQEKQTEQQYKAKQFKERSKKYAEQIKVSFKPQISEGKRKQIQTRIKSSSLSQNLKDQTKIRGIEYLQFSKQYAVKNKREQEPKTDKVLMRQQANKTQNTDYLAQVRKNNADSRLKRSVTSAQDFIKNVQKKNISGRQKQEKIIEFAENLQRKAREKQRSKNGQSNAVDEQVDKLYISAIEAKLKALQG